MKLYIHVGKNPISGYKNINLIHDNIDLNNLNTICEQSEATEIILDCILSYLHFDHIADFLTKMISRLRINGKLIIYDNDFNIISNLYNNGSIDIKTVNQLIFGQDRIKKCSCFSIMDIMHIVIGNRLIVHSTEINEDQFIIIAQRINRNE